MRRAAVSTAMAAAIFLGMQGAGANPVDFVPDTPPTTYPDLVIASSPGTPYDDVAIRTNVLAPANGYNKTHKVLAAGKTYRFIARGGTYSYRTGAGRAYNRADVECSSLDSDVPTLITLPNPVPSNPFPWARRWVPNRYGTGSRDFLDVFIDGKEVEWKTFTGLPCDPQTHLYYYDYTPTVNIQPTLLVNEDTSVPGAVGDNGYYDTMNIPTLPPLANYGYLYVTILML